MNQNLAVLLRNAQETVASVQHLTDLCYGVNAHWWKTLDLKSDELANLLIVPTKIMLIVTELAEAVEAHRRNLKDDKLPTRPGLEVELADALIRIFDLGGALGLDLAGAFQDKLLFNTSRTDHTAEARAQTNGKKY